MRFMMIMYPGPHAEARVMPGDTKLFEAMGAYNDELVKACVLLAAEGLRPTKEGARVRFTGGKPTVIDGPFTEIKEMGIGSPSAFQTASGNWLLPSS
jgi:hypothetical protein